MTVVLIGDADWGEIPFLVDAIERRGESAIVWDTGQWPGSDPVAYDVKNNVCRVSQSVLEETVTGVYMLYQTVFRELAALSSHTDKADTGPTGDENSGSDTNVNRSDQLSRLRQAREWRYFFFSTAYALKADGATVIPEPYGLKWHGMKPFMLDEFADAGVPVPPTIVTTDADRAKAFIQKHEKVVCHSINGGIEPEVLTAESYDEKEFTSLQASPVKFQGFVPGVDVRCYVLDGDVIGAFQYVFSGETFSFKKAESEQVHVEPVDLPSEAVAAVRTAIDVTPAPFGAVDLRLTTDDEFAVLEVNITGRFAASDHAGITTVADELAGYLINKSG